MREGKVSTCVLLSVLLYVQTGGSHVIGPVQTCLLGDPPSPVHLENLNCPLGDPLPPRPASGRLAFQLKYTYWKYSTKFIQDDISAPYLPSLVGVDGGVFRLRLMSF